jgi:hypothetical protein
VQVSTRDACGVLNEVSGPPKPPRSQPPIQLWIPTLDSHSGFPSHHFQIVIKPINIALPRALFQPEE